VLVEGYRRMTAAQKVRQIGEMYGLAQQLALADIQAAASGGRRARGPDALGVPFFGTGTHARAFGWDPDKEGY
jgi:hypothetical protein